VEAYASQMSAVYLMEAKKYQEALDNLVKTKIIYEKIAKYKDTLEAIIYKEKVSQIDTLLRLCVFNLKGAATAEEETKHMETLLGAFPKKKELED